MIPLIRTDGVTIEVNPALVEALEPVPVNLLPAGVTDATSIRLAGLEVLAVIGTPPQIDIALGGNTRTALLRVDGASVYVTGALVEALEPVPVDLLPPQTPPSSSLRFSGLETLAVIGSPAQIAGQFVVFIGNPDRRDHSVNGSLVDGFDGATPVLRTKTDAHPAGGYNGGGVGNKAILGFFAKGAMPLSALQSLAFVVEQLTPEAGLVGNVIPYMNVIVELDPQGPHAGVYSILSMMSREFPLLNLGSFVDAAPIYSVSWDAQLHFCQVVSDRGLFRTSLPLPVWDPPFPLAGPPGQFVPPSVGVGGDPPPGSWTSRSYSLGQILGFYPLAQVVNASSLDGGMPKTTITSGLALVLGDSANVKQNACRLLSWKLNGADI